MSGMTTIRTLGPGDAAGLEAFLVQHAESSMFLRSNSRAAGLTDRGERYQATYVAAEDGGRIVAVAAHGWNGMVMVQAPIELAAIVQSAVAQTRRPVRGLSGPWSQVVAARHALGLADRAAQMESREDLMGLDLEALRLPDALAGGGVECRPPLSGELDIVTGWRIAYSVEALGATDSPALRAQCRADVEAKQRDGRHWLLLDAGRPVAYSAFNAWLPDIVQVGGVWTPPELRGRGYARCVVAGTLLAAKRQGVRRAVLFTGRENVRARRAYLALGFQVIGEYGLVLFGGI